MEDLPKTFIKVLLSALIRLEFYHDAELSFEDILDQADGRSSLSREGLSSLCTKYVQTLRSLAQENPSNLQDFLASSHHSSAEISAIEEIWAEEKALVLRGLLDKREIEWTLKAEPSWTIDLQTIGKSTETTSVPVVNFKFDMARGGQERTLQFSVEKENLGLLLNALEQANLYLSSNLSS
jgi:hypothetical protein